MLPPPADRPWYTYTVFLAGGSAKLGSCDIQPLRKSTATCTSLKLIVSGNSCIYEQSKTPCSQNARTRRAHK